MRTGAFPICGFDFGGVNTTARSVNEGPWGGYGFQVVVSHVAEVRQYDVRCETGASSRLKWNRSQDDSHFYSSGGVPTIDSEKGSVWSMFFPTISGDVLA